MLGNTSNGLDSASTWVFENIDTNSSTKFTNRLYLADFELTLSSIKPRFISGVVTEFNCKGWHRCVQDSKPNRHFEVRGYGGF